MSKTPKNKISVPRGRGDFKNQVQLFTEDGVSENIAGGEPILKLQGSTIEAIL